MWIFFTIIECKFLVWIYWSVLKSDYLSLFSSSSLFYSFKYFRVDLFWFESAFHWSLKICVCFPLAIELFLCWTCFYLIIPWFPWCEVDENQVRGIQIDKKKKKLKNTLKPLLKGKNYFATVEIRVVFFLYIHSWQAIHLRVLYIWGLC